MDLRKTINESPRLASAIAVAVCALALALLSWEMWGGRASPQAANAGKAFFSDDDGKSWFVDDDSNLSPFDHGGKTAYRAAVYRCGTGKPFVAYLERYSDAQLARIAAQAKAIAERNPNGPQMKGAPDFPMDVKKPGEATWFPPTAQDGKFDAANYQRVTKLECPDGSTITMVMPADADAH
jgi:hypothetical protein